jgi:hypothetical protein
MKCYLIIFCVLVMACQQEEKYKLAEDDLDAATLFVRSTLEGNYPKALFYLYKDTANTNKMLLDSWKKYYDLLPVEEKLGFKAANIIVINSQKINDSTTSFTYSNSFKKEKTTLSIIQKEAKWWVDLKDFMQHP